MKRITMILFCLLLALSILPLSQHSVPNSGAQTVQYEKRLLFEDDFESGFAPWWTLRYGSYSLSTSEAHSPMHSYVTDGERDAIAYEWFPSTIIGEFEVWFYDSMTSPASAVAATSWETGMAFGLVIWHGGAFETYYGYCLGYDNSPYVSTIPRTLGWHRVNIVHEPDRAYILVDGALLYEADRHVRFRGVIIGDLWTDNGVSWTYYDDAAIWLYVPPPVSYGKSLRFADDFEGAVASWWTTIEGTPNLSPLYARSGATSYVTDEDWDYLQYRWFPSSILGEFEVWFYDTLTPDGTTLIATHAGPSLLFGLLTWSGGDWETYYAYRINRDVTRTSFLRSIGWHKVNIIHEPDRALILLDDQVLYESIVPIEFKGFVLGDLWTAQSYSYFYYDDVRVWEYVPRVDAEVVFHPEIVTAKGGGKWITAYIELPSGWDPNTIVLDSLRLNDVIPAITDPKYAFVSDPTTYLVDYDADGVLERLAKFSKADVLTLLQPGVNTVTLSGDLQGTPFIAHDDIELK